MNLDKSYKTIKELNFRNKQKKSFPILPEPAPHSICIKTFSTFCRLDLPPTPAHPCQPSPCGPNSQCKELNGQAVCSCLPAFIGNPPGCRPECVTSAECSHTKACLKNKCSDPCPNTCGQNANCQVIHHSPICSCKIDFTGDPFTRCYPIPSKKLYQIDVFCLPTFFYLIYKL